MMCIVIKKKLRFFVSLLIILVLFGLFMSLMSNIGTKTRFNANNASLSEIYENDQNIMHHFKH